MPKSSDGVSKMKYSTETRQNLMNLVDSTAKSLINVALACHTMEEGKKPLAAIEGQYKKLRESHQNYEAALAAARLAQESSDPD